jgi:hypothetical protein
MVKISPSTTTSTAVRSYVEGYTPHLKTTAGINLMVKQKMIPNLLQLCSFLNINRNPASG